MLVIRPRKHVIVRKDHVAKEYPFNRMLIGDYFVDLIEYEPAIKAAVKRANSKFRNRYFCVKIVNDEVVCERVE